MDELLPTSHAFVIAELPLIEESVAHKALDNETKLATQPWYDPIIYLFINVMDPHDMTCFMTCLRRKMFQVNFISSPSKRSKLYLPLLKLAKSYVVAQFLLSTRTYPTYYLCMPQPSASGINALWGNTILLFGTGSLSACWME